MLQILRILVHPSPLSNMSENHCIQKHYARVLYLVVVLQELDILWENI